jgi:hypothetical protein
VILTEPAEGGHVEGMLDSVAFWVAEIRAIEVHVGLGDHPADHHPSALTFMGWGFAEAPSEDQWAGIISQMWICTPMSGDGCGRP